MIPSKRRNGLRWVLLVSTVVLGFQAKAAMPFEGVPKVHYQGFPMESNYLEKEQCYGGECRFRKPGSDDTLSIRFLTERGPDSSNIHVYRNHQLVQKIIDPAEFTPLTLPDSLWTTDLDNNRTIDIKALIGTAGCGLAASLYRKIYLMGKPDGTFAKYAFTDFSDEAERDFNRDGTYEIIAVSHINHRNHSYWVYDLFTQRNQTLQNISKRYDYPLLIQHLNRYNDTVTQRISRSDMSRFSVRIPDAYDERH